MVAPVELPTRRRSYDNTSTLIDIHDPKWIPVLDSSVYKSRLSPTEKEVSHAQHPATFSLFPSQTNSPKPHPAFSHFYSKSSTAPESVRSDSDTRSQSPQDGGEPLPSIGVPFHDLQDVMKGHSWQAAATTTVSSEERTSASREPQGELASTSSTEERAAVGEEPALSRQGMLSEQTMESTANPAIDSFMTSTKKISVLPPTSKYNRKPVASMANTTVGRRSMVPSLPQTPQDSPSPYAQGICRKHYTIFRTAIAPSATNTR